MECIKEIKNGERIYNRPSVDGTPGVEIETYGWELDEFINYCLFPIRTFIKIMNEKEETNEDADILIRLYDSAFMKLTDMADAVFRDVGTINIVTHNSDHYDFLQQDILDVYIEKKKVKKADTRY